jgi:hypothetical protein
MQVPKYRSCPPHSRYNRVLRPTPTSSALRPFRIRGWFQGKCGRALWRMSSGDTVIRERRSHQCVRFTRALCGLTARIWVAARDRRFSCSRGEVSERRCRREASRSGRGNHHMVILIIKLVRKTVKDRWSLGSCKSSCCAAMIFVEFRS